MSNIQEISTNTGAVKTTQVVRHPWKRGPSDRTQADEDVRAQVARQDEVEGLTDQIDENDRDREKGW